VVALIGGQIGDNASTDETSAIVAAYLDLWIAKRLLTSRERV